MKTYIFTIASILVLITSCTKNNEKNKELEDKTAVITGYFFRDDTGNPIGYSGNPNTKLTQSDNPHWSDIRIECYPNPCNIGFWVSANNLDDDISKRIVITEATFNTNATPTEESIESLDDLGVEKLLDSVTIDKNYFIDISSFDDGYYRVYIEIEGEIFYDNLKKGNIHIN